MFLLVLIMIFGMPKEGMSYFKIQFYTTAGIDFFSIRWWYMVGDGAGPFEM